MAYITNKLPIELRRDFGVPLDTILDLKAVESAPLTDKTSRFVKEKRAYYNFDIESTDAPNDDDIVKPNDIAAAPGRWIRAHQLHEQLTDLQGGAVEDRFHLTAIQHDDLVGGGLGDDQHGHSTSAIAGEISDSQHGDRSGGTLHPIATQSDNGFLSKEDKKVVDDLVGAPILIGHTLSVTELTGDLTLPASSVVVPAGVYSKIWVIASAQIATSSSGTSEITILANSTPISSILFFDSFSGAGPSFFTGFSADVSVPGAWGGANCMQVIIQDGTGPGEIDLTTSTQTISWGAQSSAPAGNTVSANRSLTVFGFK